MSIVNVMGISHVSQPTTGQCLVGMTGIPPHS